jgi:hypothetical protein
MEQRRFYVHPTRGDFLFLEWDSGERGWMPSLHTMEDWQYGQNRIYSPEDKPSVLVTMPGHVVWPRLVDETLIRGLLAPPWIQDGQYTEGIPETDIDVNDAILVQHLLDNPPVLTQDQVATFERLYRPRLHDPTPLRLERPDHLEQAITASLSAPPRPRPGPLPPPFPAHLVDPVLAAAEAEGKLCSITMEPIRKQSASITSCGHIFQKEAIREWMKGHDTCPECRVRCSTAVKN